MKCRYIAMGNQGPVATPLRQLFLALVAETVWSNEYTIHAYFDSNKPFLEITHPAFLPKRPLVIREGPGATVDGVEKAVLAHIGAQLKLLQEQSAALQFTSASLSDAQNSIFRATAKAAVVAQFPEAAECRAFSPYGWSDFACFILGHGFGHTTFVARGDCPEFSGGIVKIDMPGDEWIHLEFAKKYKRFWAELAKVFAARELKIPKDDLYLLKIFVTEDLCVFHPTEVLFQQQFSDGKIVVTFGTDNLPASMVRREEEVEV